MMRRQKMALADLFTVDLLMCLFGFRLLFAVPFCDAYTTTSEPCISGELRLVGGNDEYEGRVEICHSNQWGTVCDDEWDEDDARVVCRKLGYSTSGAAAFPRGYFGQGSGPIWLDNVNCDGDEDSLRICRSSDYGKHDCTHIEDAGVRCEGNSYCSNGQVRLVGGSDEYEGRVEICRNNQWGSICDYSWDEDDAKVVCRQLGYSTEGARAYSKAHYGLGYGRIWLKDVRCSGNDNTLSDCSSQLYVKSSYHCHDHTDDAGVRCGSGGTDTPPVQPTSPRATSPRATSPRANSPHTDTPHTQTGTFNYGAIIGGSIAGGILLFLCLCVVFFCICIRIGLASDQSDSQHQTTYKPLQQYPPSTTDHDMESCDSDSHGGRSSYVAAEHAQQFETLEEDPPSYSDVINI